jgi:hypothetical protein
MHTVKDINLGKVLNVQIFFKGSDLPTTYKGYDSGEGAWKEENGMVVVHLIDLVGSPDRDREPRWIPVAKLEQVERVETSSFLNPDSNH